MPATLYRIKLYGHSGDDTETFCKNLAVILGIDLEEARSLLLESPAVIKEGVEREKAEEFCKLLEPIRALCIVEPLDGVAGESAPLPGIASALLSERSKADDVEKKATLRSWTWTTALVVTIGAFLLFVVIGLISSFWGLYSHNRPPAKSFQGIVGSTESQADPQASGAGLVSFEDLQSQIDEVEARIESQRFRLAEAEKDRDRLHRTTRAQSRDLEESALIIRNLKNVIRNDVTQLRILKQKAEEIQQESK